MLKPLILIMSCERDRANGRQRAVEDTWMMQWGGLIPFRIILGGRRPDPLHGWELFISVDDSYGSVPAKYQIARVWARTNGYTHVFHACVDTWVNVPRLLASGFENHDYTGYPCDGGYASGGMGYWLSAKAIEVLLERETHVGASEDMWVGHTLRAAGIPFHEDRRYSSPANPNRPDDEITLHLSRGTDNYDPQWMRDIHKQFLETGHA